MGIRSLQWRLIFIFISITLSLMIFVSVILNKSVQSSYYDLFTEQVKNALVNSEIFDAENPQYEYIIDRLDNKVAYPLKGASRSYTIIDKDTSQIKYSSHKNFSEDSVRFRYEIFRSENLIASMAAGEGRKSTQVRVGGVNYFDYAVKAGSHVIYIMLDSREISPTIEKFSKIIQFSSGLAVLASLVIGFILSKTITVPIGNIANKARRLAEGDFDQMVEVKSGDEIGRLTETFNYMAGELKNKILEISREKSKIETILNYMTDGVIAFDIFGRVIHANPASKQIMGVFEPDMGFVEFAGKYDIEISLEDIIALNESCEKEKVVRLPEKAVRIYFAHFSDETGRPEGVIAVIQDITEQQRLDDMRREFVANVSHELRTPLTSVKSYAETLMDGAVDDRDTAMKFLSVINSEADRMTRLVKDLLQLSRLDSSQQQWNREEVSLSDLVKGSVEKLEFEAKNKKHELNLYIEDDAPFVEGDRDKIEQVILNILTNAIKYTPEGGIVTVNVGKNYNEAYVKVSDTGIGIPKEDIPRLCERFYRVDKARSREMGGTGLGLAIAKEITEAHGGSIAISSEVGKGTEVTVTLPICNPILNAV
ncbi:MAG: cell wall metabolism sensor histidine kinase WalK [Clostridia bacterium]|nr:cell wall metabolism sensor histidine kinase WalK [Clostridia bacterium]